MNPYDQKENNPYNKFVYTGYQDLTVKPKEEQGDFARGVSTTFKQLPQLGYGLVAAAGAGAESAFGEGGLSTGLKKWGVKGYEDWASKIQETSKESDEFLNSWEKAKQGDVGSLIDFVQYGLGYAAGQGAQTLATAGVGKLAAQMAFKKFGKEYVEGLVEKEVGKLAATEAAKDFTEDALRRAAVVNIADKIGRTGAITAVGAQAFGMEGGEIGGDLAKQSVNENRSLTGEEIAKGFVSTLGAGALEFIGDKIGLDLMMGKSSLLKPASAMGGVTGRVARGTIAAAGAAPIEAGTEFGQTLIEEYGKGKDAFSDESMRHAINAAALGGVGGGGIGFASGSIRAPKPIELPSIGDQINQERQTQIDLHTTELANAGTVGQAIQAAQQINDVPIHINTAEDFDTSVTPIDLLSEDQKLEEIRNFINTQEMQTLMSSISEEERALVTSKIESALSQDSEERSKSINEFHAFLNANNILPSQVKAPQTSEVAQHAPIEQAPKNFIELRDQAKEIASSPEWQEHLASLPESERIEANDIVSRMSDGRLPARDRKVLAETVIEYASQALPKLAKKSQITQTNNLEPVLAPTIIPTEIKSNDPRDIIANTKFEDAIGTLNYVAPELLPTQGEGLTRQAAESIQKLGKALGKNVHFFNQNNAQVRLDGYANPDHQNDIFVNVGRGDAGWHYVAGHEFFHQLPSDLKRKFIESVTPLIPADKLGKLKDYINQGTLDDGGQWEEIGADLFGNRFGEPDFLSKLLGGVTDTPTLLKMVKAIREFVDSVLASLKTQGFATDKFVTDLQKVRDSAQAILQEHLNQVKETQANVSEPTKVEQETQAAQGQEVAPKEKASVSKLLTLAHEWDVANRSGRNDEWFSGSAESNQSFNSVSDEGSAIPAHGMAKAKTLGEALKNLVSMVNNGIDPNKTIYYESLTRSAGSAHAGATAGGVAYRDGPFIVTFREGLNGRQPTASDITGVLVNPVNANLIEDLQQMFPNIVVRSYNDVADVVAASKSKGAAEYANAAEPAKVEQETTEKKASEDEAQTILSQAGITGKERLDAIKDVKAGTVSIEELKSAYPPSVQFVREQQRIAAEKDRAFAEQERLANAPKEELEVIAEAGRDARVQEAENLTKLQGFDEDVPTAIEEKMLQAVDNILAIPISKRTSLQKKMLKKFGIEETRKPRPKPINRKKGVQGLRDSLKRKNPFLAFLAENGINTADRSDVGGQDSKRYFAAGYGAIFRNKGLRLDELAQLAEEQGFLTQAEVANESDNGGVNRLAEMINQAINGEVVTTGEQDFDFQSYYDDQLKNTALEFGIDIRGKSLDRLAELVNMRYAAMDEATIAAREAEFELQLQEISNDLLLQLQDRSIENLLDENETDNQGIDQDNVEPAATIAPRIDKQRNLKEKNFNRREVERILDIPEEKRSKKDTEFLKRNENKLSSERKEIRDLVITHNLTEANLIHADKMGGIAVPSLAITKAESPIEGFGEITLIGSKSLADPKGYAKSQVFGADIYSPRYPGIDYKVGKDELKIINSRLAELNKKFGLREIYANDLNGNALRELADKNSVKAAALEEKGITVEPVIINGKIDDWKSKMALRTAMQENNLYGIDEQYAKKLLENSGAKEQIFKGYSSSGNKQYTPHTLENVVKILKQELRGGENFNYGAGSLRAKFTPRFKSIRDIQLNKDRLVSRESFDKVKSEIDAELLTVSNAMNTKRLDDAIGILEDAPKIGLDKAAKQYDLELSDEAKEKAAEFLNKLKNLPTEYFEAKILRDVDLSEFSGAVVPKGISDKALSILKRNGIPVKEYENDDDRVSAIHDFAVQRDQEKGDILFSKQRNNIDADLELESIFAGLDKSGLARARAQSKLDALPNANEIQYVQDNFLDILEKLEDAGVLSINCD